LEETLASFKIGVLTVSSTRSEANDGSGDAVDAALRIGEAVQVERAIVNDDVSAIVARLRILCAHCDLVLTTGGTGFSPDDVTPEATASLIDRWASSLVELVRSKGQETTAFAFASRGIAGVCGRCLVVNLPGSPDGARQGTEALLPILPHILSQLRGERHAGT
jgi:molybdenum cofactor synthesis domain-containing protein